MSDKEKRKLEEIKSDQREIQKYLHEIWEMTFPITMPLGIFVGFVLIARLGIYLATEQYALIHTIASIAIIGFLGLMGLLMVATIIAAFYLSILWMRNAYVIHKLERENDKWTS